MPSATSGDGDSSHSVSRDASKRQLPPPARPPRRRAPRAARSAATVLRPRAVAAALRRAAPPGSARSSPRATRCSDSGGSAEPAQRLELARQRPDASIAVRLCGLCPAASRRAARSASFSTARCRPVAARADTIAATAAAAAPAAALATRHREGEGDGEAGYQEDDGRGAILSGAAPTTRARRGAVAARSRRSRRAHARPSQCGWFGGSGAPGAALGEPLGASAPSSLRPRAALTPVSREARRKIALAARIIAQCRPWSGRPTLPSASTCARGCCSSRGSWRSRRPGSGRSRTPRRGPGGRLPPPILLLLVNAGLGTAAARFSSEGGVRARVHVRGARRLPDDRPRPRTRRAARPPGDARRATSANRDAAAVDVGRLLLVILGWVTLAAATASASTCGT